jgi:hypothetical protein
MYGYVREHASGFRQSPGRRAKKITAKFPQGTVEITQFEDVKKAAAGKE